MYQSKIGLSIISNPISKGNGCIGCNNNCWLICSDGCGGSCGDGCTNSCTYSCAENCYTMAGPLTFPNQHI